MSGFCLYNPDTLYEPHNVDRGAALTQDNCLLKTIRVILLEKLDTGENNASDIASELNMSLSTFKRKLIAEGIDFKKAKDAR